MLEDAVAPPESSAHPADPAYLVCTRCGLGNPPGERFCRSCSAFLEWSGKAVEARAPVEVPVPEEVIDLGPTRLRDKAWNWAFFGDEPTAVLPPPPAPGADEIDWSRTGATTPADAAGEAEAPGVVRPDETPAVAGPVIGVRGLFADSDEADVGCRTCGTGNQTGRYFCRRCGTALDVPPPPPRLSRWERRRLERLSKRESRQQLELGGRPKVKRQAVGGIAGGWITSLVAKIFLGIGIAFAGLSMAGPFAQPIRNTVSGWYHDVRRTIAPEYVPINPVGATASSAVSSHPALAAIDGQTNTYWAAAGQPVGEALTISFGSRVDVDQVGFLIGIQGANYLNQPRPQLLHLTFDDGSTADLSLVDSSSFQTFKVHARHTSQVQIVVESVFQSAVGQNVAMTEVEFRSKK
ncbi:MAG TPA: discoidin domain-containing protein [Acidimicrobiales bacterium]|nr:discoidin domain-containing protein [Acidimicrobiales bacterium]